MSGRIKEEDVTYIRERCAIDEVVADYVQLKSAGGGQKKGLCPFHDEKSPSFHVTPSKGFFHCFGCQTSGDVISFVMKMDHLSFTETIERLADRMGYQLRYEEGNFTPAPAGNRTRLIAANALAAKFYQDQLNTSPTAAHARELMTKRGFDKAACERFGVGYAPDEWDGLTKFLRAEGYTIDELETAGLSKMGQRGPIDKFRNRLTWPIRDISGDVVGFGARKLASDEEDQGPKYLNTSETPVYKKSQVLYGLDMAKKEIAKKRQVVIVEGYTDVMAAQLAGITTAVATCGTAFGADHIRIIRRLLMDDDAFRGEVIFTFDGDAAGQKAALRAFSEDQKFVTQTFVAVEPDGLDPCDLRQQKGDLALRDLIAKRVPLFEFAIKTELGLHKLDSAEGRVNALNATAPLVAQIRDKSLRPEYTRLLAGWLGVEVELVTAAVNQGLKSRPQSASAAPLEESTANVQWRPNPQEPRLILEREVLKARLQMPTLILNWAQIESGAFTHPAYSQLAAIISAAPEQSSIEIEQVADENMRALFTELNVEPIRADGEVTGHYVESIVARLREVAISRAIADLKSSLQRLNPVENEQEYTAAFTSLVALETTRRGLHDLALRSI
ncbi:DNA primase [Actinobacteria bacterium IMCC26103]|nr:DNA primase [Actinobacteria bacterium IMCC26103]